MALELVLNDEDEAKDSGKSLRVKAPAALGPASDDPAKHEDAGQSLRT